MSESARMKAYWDMVGNHEKVNWHIAHIDDPSEFVSSGVEALLACFGGDLESIPVGARVLEIGCGKGRLTHALAEVRPDVRAVGLDVSAKMIELAYSEAGELSNVAFVVGDGASLAIFPDNTFDVVYSYIVFQHLPRHVTAQYILEAGRVLKLDGKFVFQVQQRDEIQEIDPPCGDFRKIRYYTEAQIQAAILPPLELVAARGKGHDYFLHTKKTAQKPK